MNNLITKRRFMIGVLLFVHCSLLVAQDRSRLAVYVPMPTGGNREQQEFFQSYFKMELIGANYPSVETKAESRYTLNLNIENNLDFDPELPEETGNDRYNLSIRLIRSADDSEVVSFSFPFTILESMNNWTLYLLYNTLANAYVPPDGNGDGSGNGEGLDSYSAAMLKAFLDDRWRNKWFYISGSVGMDLKYLMAPGTNESLQGSAMPTIRLGLEWHFLNFLSLHLAPGLGILHHGGEYILEPTVAAMVAGVWKPLNYMMIEPYLGVEYFAPMSSMSAAQDPRVTAMGGVQLGLKGGSRGAITVDFGVSYGFLGRVVLVDGTNGSVIRFAILAGYKVGFWDRKKPGE